MKMPSYIALRVSHNRSRVQPVAMSSIFDTLVSVTAVDT